MLDKPVIFSIPPKTHEQLLLEATSVSTPLSEADARLFIEAAHELSPDHAMDHGLGYCIWQAIARVGLNETPLSSDEMKNLRGMLADGEKKAAALEASKVVAEQRLRFRFLHMPLYREIATQASAEKLRDLERAVGVVCLAWQIKFQPGNIRLSTKRRISYMSSADNEPPTQDP
ncbi:MAG: hypothetical protein WCW31_04135 [Patescibacteria group bacterium]|jgi:hypothetical protein